MRECGERSITQLDSDASMCERLLSKYEGERGELEHADQDFEQAHGALSLISGALAALAMEQQGVLDAIRLQAVAYIEHTRHAHVQVMEHQRWLKSWTRTNT